MLSRAVLCGALMITGLVSGCGVGGTEVDSKPSAVPSATPSAQREAAEQSALRQSVQGYANDMLTGSIGAYDNYFAASCKAKVDRNQFQVPLSWAKDAYGRPRPIKTFDATIHGTYADVSYTFGPVRLDQNHEVWVLQDGKWLTTDCA